MADNSASSPVLLCRRCHQPFSPPTAKIFLPSCPHCGTALHPLFPKLKSNRNAHFTGRYSLLDLLVVAIIIVVVRFQGLAEAKALPGTAFFALAVFLSIAAGFSVNLQPRQP